MTVPSVPTWVSPTEGATVDASVDLEWTASTLDGGGGVTTVHEDNFTATAGTLLVGDSHTPDTGSGYAIMTGGAYADFKVIESGMVGNNQPGSTNARVVAGTSIAADVVVRGKMKFIGGSDAGVCEIGARITDADNRIMLGWNSFTPGWTYRHVVAGTSTILGTENITPTTDGTVEYEVEITLAANGDVTARVHDGTSWTTVYTESANTDLATGGALASGSIGIDQNQTSISDTSGAKIIYLAAEE